MIFLTSIIKITSGSNKKVADFVDGLYKSIIPAGTHLVSSIIVAESAKIIENVQREDLNSLEEAEAYNNLINEYNLTHEEISKYTGKSRSHISNFIRIVGLPKDIKLLLVEKKISFGHARALLSSKNISKKLISPTFGINYNIQKSIMQEIIYKKAYNLLFMLFYRLFYVFRRF